MAAQSRVKKRNRKNPTARPTARRGAPEAGAATERPSPVALLAESAHLLVEQRVSQHHLPAEILVQHAKILLDTVRPHVAAMRAVGFDPALLDELPRRVSLVQAAQTVRQTRRAAYTDREAALIRAAEAHRREMIRVARYALRHSQDAQATLSELQKGSGLPDLVQDLEVLAHLFDVHRALVAGVGVDVGAAIVDAEAHVTGVSEVVSERTRRAKGGLSEVALRRKAVAYALETLREIRDAAAFVLHRDDKAIAVLRGLGVRERAVRGGDEGEPSEGEPASPVE